MKKLAFIIVIAVLIYGYAQEQGISLSNLVTFSSGTDSTLQEAYRNHQSNIQIQGKGTVARVLPDDLEGSRHQKFILRLSTGQTLAVAHNIDLAPRVSGLKSGDTVEFFGEYEWNSKGGVIHWTHDDPNNIHIGGWLKHQGRTYN